MENVDAIILSLRIDEPFMVRNEAEVVNRVDAYTVWVVRVERVKADRVISFA